MATSSADKARADELRRLYTELVALPAEQGRKVAAKQQEQLSNRLLQYRDKLGGFFGRWREFDADLDEITQQIVWGDELSAKDDEPSRKKRRQHYARAYIRGRTAVANLDKEIADGSTYEVAIRDVISSVAKTTTSVVDEIKDTVDDIKDNASTGLWLSLAGLLAVGLVWASQKGKR